MRCHAMNADVIIIGFDTTRGPWWILLFFSTVKVSQTNQMCEVSELHFGGLLTRQVLHRSFPLGRASLDDTRFAGISVLDYTCR